MCRADWSVCVCVCRKWSAETRTSFGMQCAAHDGTGDLSVPTKLLPSPILAPLLLWSGCHDNLYCSHKWHKKKGDIHRVALWHVLTTGGLTVREEKPVRTWRIWLLTAHSTYTWTSLRSPLNSERLVVPSDARGRKSFDCFHHNRKKCPFIQSLHSKRWRPYTLKSNTQSHKCSECSHNLNY